ncbi:hypothetical protein SVIOM74S_05497 [Streptomyces violarus]
MRVLFATMAARSHVYAQVTLASALRTAGHEVLVASQPDVLDDIVRAGLTAVRIGEDLNIEEETREANASFEDDRNLGGLAMSNTRDDPFPWDHALGMFTAMTAMVFQNVCPEPMVDDLVGLARDWRPDLVVWDPLTLAGPVAARLSGAAHARLLFGPDQMGRNRTAFRALLDRQPPELRDDPLAEWLTWTLERCGGSAGDMSEELVLGQWTIDPTPPSMRIPLDLPCVPVRYVPYNGPSLLPDWLREPPRHPRRLCLTLGVSLGEATGAGTVAASDVLAAVDGLDVEVVATLPRELREELGTLPANVRAVDFVPLNALLPSCSGIIHHGGGVREGRRRGAVGSFQRGAQGRQFRFRCCGPPARWIQPIVSGSSIRGPEVVRQPHPGAAVAGFLDDPFAAHGGDGMGGHLLPETDAPGPLVELTPRRPGAQRAVGGGPDADALAGAGVLDLFDVDTGREHGGPGPCVGQHGEHGVRRGGGVDLVLGLLKRRLGHLPS